MTDTHIDGNALAGPLGEVFAVDIVAALARCSGCGRTDALGAATVWGAPMGYIARCAGCGHELLRYASTPREVSLDLRGIAVIRFPVQYQI